jgi:hypothetical protein
MYGPDWPLTSGGVYIVENVQDTLFSERKV